MAKKERLEWLLRRIPEEPGGIVDVCNQDFVDDYIEATDAPHRVRLWGAHACPQLGRDLLELTRKRKLKRGRTGVQGMGGLGFPTWVWSYRIAPVHVFDFIEQ